MNDVHIDLELEKGCTVNLEIFEDTIFLVFNVKVFFCLFFYGEVLSGAYIFGWLLV